ATSASVPYSILFAQSSHQWGHLMPLKFPHSRTRYFLYHVAPGKLKWPGSSFHSIHSTLSKLCQEDHLVVSIFLSKVLLFSRSPRPNIWVDQYLYLNLPLTLYITPASLLGGCTVHRSELVPQGLQLLRHYPASLSNIPPNQSVSDK